MLTKTDPIRRPNYSTIKRGSLLFAVGGAAALAVIATAPASQGQSPHTTQVPVVFSGGHDTDLRDRGRPVALIAAALGVPADMFREAFRHVHPAGPGQQPQEGQVRQNKSALMSALSPYGVTNERLDRVSNYYRYVRSRGESWPAQPASAYAVVENGIVTRFVVTCGGSGYSSPPTVTIPSIAGAKGTAQIAFSKSFDQNGSISGITP